MKRGLIAIAALFLLYAALQIGLSWSMLVQALDFWQPDQERRLVRLSEEYHRLMTGRDPFLLEQEAGLIRERSAFLVALRQFREGLVGRWVLTFSLLSLGALGVAIGGGALLLRRSLRPALALKEALARHLTGLPPAWPASRDPAIAAMYQEFSGLLRAREQLERQRRAASRVGQWQTTGRMLIHEIKNRLTPINLDVEGLLESGDSALQPGLERISANIGRIGALMNAFRELSGLPSPHLVECDLAGVVRDTAGHIGPGGCILDIGDEAIATVFTDPALLELILVNLIQNARESGADAVHLKVDNGRIGLWDNGPGLPEPLVNSIRTGTLQPGYTTKPGSNGMGLFIVSELCAALGISLGVESSAGGTQFRLEFEHG